MASGAEARGLLRKMPQEWPAPTQYALALSLVILSLLIRNFLGVYLEDRVPFALTLGTLIVLILLVRPGPFLAAALLGWLGSVFLFIPPARQVNGLTNSEAILAWFVAAILCLAVVVAYFIRKANDRRQQELSELTERYLSLFNSIDEGFCIIEILFDSKNAPVDYLFVECNPAFEQQSGINNPVGKKMKELVPGHEGRWFDIFGEIALTGKPKRFTEKAQGLGERWFDVFAFRVGPPEAKKVAVLFSDISSRRRFEQALKSSEERYRLVNLATDDVIWDWNLGTGEVLWNERLNAVFGHDLDDSSSAQTWWYDHIHPDDREEIIKSIHQSLDNHESQWRATYRFKRADGSYARVNDRGFISRDEDGRPIRMIGSLVDDSVRLEAQDALMKSEATLRAVLEALPVGLVVSDKEGRPFRYNEAHRELWGGALDTSMDEYDQWIGYWPETGKRIEKHEWAMARALKYGEVVVNELVESERLDGSGERRLFLNNAAPVRDDNGNIVAGVVAELDVTERLKAEQDLQTSEATLSALFEGLPLGVGVISNQGEILSLNSCALKLHGLSTIEEVKENPYFYYDFKLFDNNGDELPEAKWPLVQATRGKYVSEFEARLRLTSGAENFISYTTVPVEMDSDSGRFNLFVIQEISERKEAERYLRESEARFRRLADDAPVVVWMTDKEGYCTYISKPWETLTGQAPEAALGTGWLNALHPDDRDEANERYMDALKERASYKLDYRVLRSDGSLRWAANSGKPRFAENGEYLGYIGSVLDISERKELEQALQDSDRKKDEFLAILAHELRNPLAAVRMAMTALKRGKGDKRTIEKMTDIIDRQSGQLARLIDDLLDVSRITRGLVVLKQRPVDVGSIVAHAVEGIRENCASKGLRFSCNLPEKPLTVSADPIRISQVIGNLLANSCKFTERGEISLTVRELDGYVQVSVKDTGMGVPPEQLSRIFDMFTQVEDNQRRSGSGLGIGLALSKSIVELHGGQIEARSEGELKGSEFMFTLPLLVSKKHRNLLQQNTYAVNSSQQESSPRHVLAVDDNLDALSALSLVLKMKGHRVDVASDGPSALKLAEKSRPEIMLMDIGMPGMNGYEVARIIKESPWGEGIRLVALTGWGQQRDKQNAELAGFDAHLTKPVEPDELERIMAAN